MIPEALSPLANHLWQSTFFAAVAGVLTLTLRTSRAEARYWVWLTASIKFLIPLSWLVALGNRIEWKAAPAAVPAGLPDMLDHVSRPFTASAAPRFIASDTQNAHWLLTTCFCIWAVGTIGVMFLWQLKWRRVRSAVRAGSLLPLDLPIPAVSSPALLEPGVFGILHPVLMLPEGIFSRLTAAQQDAILAHELCHVRRRDNLTATIHMLVEALFWFHPLVWWIRTRLIEERERACDEEVLRLGSEPRVYAESILKVCEFYLESPIVCVAGVTGANLKRRIEAIMKNRTRHKLSFGRKSLLAAAAFIAVAGPLLIGMMNIAPLLRAQASPAFEVASIKPHKPGDRSGTIPQFLPGGRFVAAGVPMQIVIAFAYNLPFQGPQLTGGPDWIRSLDGIYDFDAKADANALKGLTPQDRTNKLRLMLQTLLAERFQLKIRRDTKEQPVYLLTVGKNGPKLQTSKLSEKDCEDSSNHCHQGGAGQGGGIHVKAFDMSELAVSVSAFTDHPLLDRTGLTGLYDIDAEGWVPMRPRRGPPPGAPPSAEDQAFADPTRPTLYMIFEKLGLKMEASKAPVDSYVIDQIDKPAGN